MDPIGTQVHDLDAAPRRCCPRPVPLGRLTKTPTTGFSSSRRSAASPPRRGGLVLLLVYVAASLLTNPGGSLSSDVGAKVATLKASRRAAASISTSATGPRMSTRRVCCIRSTSRIVWVTVDRGDDTADAPPGDSAVAARWIPARRFCSRWRVPSPPPSPHGRSPAVLAPRRVERLLARRVWRRPSPSTPSCSGSIPWVWRCMAWAVVLFLDVLHGTGRLADGVCGAGALIGLAATMRTEALLYGAVVDGRRPAPTSLGISTVPYLESLSVRLRRTVGYRDFAAFTRRRRCSSGQRAARAGVARRTVAVRSCCRQPRRAPVRIWVRRVDEAYQHASRCEPGRRTGTRRADRAV